MNSKSVDWVETRRISQGFTCHFTAHIPSPVESPNTLQFVSWAARKPI